MRRRTLLAAVPIGVLPAAGCLELRAPSDERPVPTTETPSYDPDGRSTTVRIGDRTGDIIPHDIGVWNAATTARPIHLEVVDATVGATRHDQRHMVPGDTAVVVILRAPARYRVTVGVPDQALDRSFDVPRSMFDTCNDSYSHVSVRKTGRITVRTLSTELACDTATP